jgi:methyltransferase
VLIRAVICAAIAGQRLLELRQSRKNMTIQGELREGRLARATYPGIVAVHSLTILLTLLKGGRRRPVWMVLLLAVQPVRYWVLATLGTRWNARGAVPERLEVATEGPYRYVRHPNYTVVAIELLALPLAFGVRWLALFATLTNATLLAVRIRDEERLLFAAEGYREQFEHRARFVPGLF